MNAALMGSVASDDGDIGGVVINAMQRPSAKLSTDAPLPTAQAASDEELLGPHEFVVLDKKGIGLRALPTWEVK